MENITQTPHTPGLEAHNRREDIEQKNRKALGIVNHARSILERVKRDPKMKNFHDEKTEGQWMGEWLKNQKTKIFNLYGVVQLDGVMAEHFGAPKEVEDFVVDVYQTIEM